MSALIRAQQLFSALSSVKKPRVLDATWFLPNSPFAAPEGETALSSFEKKRIPHARFLDLDGIGDPEIAPTSGHNLPNATVFGDTMAALGITRDTPVVVYDTHGVFSSPRAWHTLRAFGHEDVAGAATVLSGSNVVL